MISPRTIREVQSLNGKLAAQGHFLAKSAEKALPFLKKLKGCIDRRDFRWNQEADNAQIKPTAKHNSNKSLKGKIQQKDFTSEDPAAWLECLLPGRVFAARQEALPPGSWSLGFSLHSRRNQDNQEGSIPSKLTLDTPLDPGTDIKL
ncbi:hypothetical protein Tco_1157186 [Tanacetum coccineum]